MLNFKFLKFGNITMNPIYWLTATKPFQHLSNHFILKIEKNFMVFSTTKKQLPGIKKHFVSYQNIEGSNEVQYIFEKIHQVDPATMVIKIAEKVLNFI